MPAEAGQYELAPGTLLGSRFRIVRLMGRGGMGVVYEAMDERLNRRVALKCARPGYRYWLTPEAIAAREVSHYNVCKVHELHVLETPLGEMDCISMEFVEGETLAAYIRRAGPLSSREAREIALQISGGLAQAHRQGVVHGDLKSGNVMLSRPPAGGRLRAVVMDFGLARMMHDAVEPQPVGGTLEYMAPELLMGESATVASDIYALGVLFHVMLTGRTPPRANGVRSIPAPPEQGCEGSQASTVFLGHTIRDEEWRRTLDPLPGPWKKVTARCLEPRPDRRFRSVEALGAALERRRHVLISAAALVLTAILIVFGARQWLVSPPVTPVRLAILPVAVDGGPFASAAGVGLEVADRLTGVRRKFTVISPREAERYQVGTAAKARSTLGATHVLETHVRMSGGTLSAEAALVDLESANTIGRLSATYASDDTPALAKALVATVTGAFHLTVSTPKESVSKAAYPDYLQAMDLLRQANSRNADKAIPLLNHAITLDPRSALPYAGLADAQFQMFLGGYGAQWLSLAEASAAKAEGLNPEAVPVLLASGQIQQQHGRYEVALRKFTRAADLAPEDAEVWRRLAACYEAAGRADEAVATFRKAIEAQPNYYRHYLSLGTFYFNRGRFDLAEPEYRHVVAIAPGLASGHTNLGLVLMQDRRFSEAESELLLALRLGVTRDLLVNLGALYYAQERFEEAARYFEKSLTVGTPAAVQCRDLGDAYRQLGRSRQAAEAYGRGIDLVREDIATNPRRADLRALLALMSAFRRDRQSAEFEIAQALALGPENRSVLRNAAITFEALGNREKALAILRNAPRPLLEELSRNPDVRNLRTDPRFQELLDKNAR